MMMRRRHCHRPPGGLLRPRSRPIVERLEDRTLLAAAPADHVAGLAIAAGVSNTAPVLLDTDLALTPIAPAIRDADNVGLELGSLLGGVRDADVPSRRGLAIT